MECDRVDRENTIERYLAGALPAAEKEEWELHYFGCDRCARKLETLSLVREPLQSMAAGIRREIPEPSKSRTWIWAAAGIAAALLLAVGLGRLLPPKPAPPRVANSNGPQAPRLEDLAQLEPPAYDPRTLRGVDSKSETQFRDAMVFYQQRDYPKAIAGLRAATELDPHAAAPRFFLGASYLLSGNTADGIRELRAVADGPSPFREEAAFDLAKGYLRQGDRDSALRELRRVVALHGDLRDQAEQLTARISGSR